MSERRAIRRAASLFLLPVLAAGGCSSIGGGGGNPFGSTNDFDRTFISAAQTWDLNKDGDVTCDEWIQYLGIMFREHDANGDGFLDAEEYAAMARSDRLFEVAKLPYYDANKDGKVTLQEMTGTHNVAFKLLDRNQDCRIDRTETVQVHDAVQPKPKEVDQSMPRTSPGSGGIPGR